MQKTKFNDGWMFQRGGGSALEALMGGSAELFAVTLPHDASVSTERNPKEPNGSGNGFFREENYVYTKKFSMNPEDREKNVWVEFEGVYQNAFVYLNGSFAGKCPYGYSNFYVDLTKYIHWNGENELKVIVRNGVPSGRWYTGGGIYRDVNIMVADRMHFAPDEVHFAATDVEAGMAVLRVEAAIEYTGTGVRDMMFQAQLLDKEGRIVAESQMPVTVTEHTKAAYQQKLYVADPELWDEDHPYLYSYCVRLVEGEKVCDEECGTFGIRKLQLDRVHGLRVNGKAVKLRGGCIHHDNGITGTAEFTHAAEFRVKKMKEAGYNAIRSSHYPMSRKLLEACDRLGVYVMDEYSDVWSTTKVDFDYGTHMTEWWEHDLANLVKKDYNHPCVIMYSIGNEIPETGNKFDTQWGKKFADKLRQLDDSRYVTNSLNLMLSIMDQIPKLMSAKAAEEPQEINSMMSNLGEMMNLLISSELAGKATEEAAAQVDIVGYNYATCRYEQDGEIYPNRILVGSETYPHELDKNWELVEKLPYLLGDFSWTAWDYLGEAGIGKITYGEPQGMSFYAPYPCKAAYCSDMNLIGDRRPVSYWREIIWGLRQAPYLAAQPPMHYGEHKNLTAWTITDAVRRWNWAGYEGKPIVVEVYTDAEEAELFLNGVSAGRKEVGVNKKAMVQFDTVYQPGTVEVVVYTDGVETGRDQMKTAGWDTVIAVSTDRSSVPADGSDITYVDICLQDGNQIINPEVVTPVTVTLEGPGMILGYGSADPESEENYFDTTAVPFEGRLRAAVRGTGMQGKITVTCSAEGCAPKTVEIQTV